METRHTISVALATYNGERFLREQLDSLLSQSVPFTELVVCDDCSTDSTRAILREYAASDPRIKVVENERNLGFRRNFEKAIRLCEGDLIALCDQDDIWLEGHIEILANGIGDNLLVAGASIITDEHGNTTGTRLTELKNFNPGNRKPEDIFRFVMFYQNPFQGASMMMRREFRAYALPVPESIAYHDVWFVHLASLLGEFRFIDTPVTLYRLHGSNTSGDHRHTSRLRTFIGHFVRSSFGNNRPEVAAALDERRKVLSPSACRLLDEAIGYYDGRSLPRRLTNLIYELRHYRKIYGTR